MFLGRCNVLVKLYSILLYILVVSCGVSRAFSPILPSPVLNEVFISPSSSDAETEEFVEIRLPPTTTTRYLRQYALAVISPRFIEKYYDFMDMEDTGDDAVDDNTLVVVSNNEITPNLQLFKSTFSLRPISIQAILLITKPADSDLTLLELKKIRSILRLPNKAPITNGNKEILRRLVKDAVMYKDQHTEDESSSWLTDIFPSWTGDIKKEPPGGDPLYDRVSLARCRVQSLAVERFVHDSPSPGILNPCVQTEISDTSERHPNGLSLLTATRERAVVPTEPSVSNPNRNLGDSRNWVENWLPQLKEAGYVSKNMEEFFLTNENRRLYNLIQNDNGIPESSIRCELCFKESNKESSTIPFDKRHAPNIVLATGQPFLKTPSESWRRINTHENMPYHKSCLAQLKSNTEDGHEADLYDEIPPDENLYQTANKFALVYLEIKVGMSLRGHEVMAEGLLHLGFPFGNLLNTRQAAAEITKFMGSKIHTNLINRLIASDMEFSLMMDSSTDIGSVHTMLIYIRYVEDNAPVTKVLFLTESHDSTAAGMWKEMEDAFKAEGVKFTNYVKRKCVAMATDGAANMMANSKSLKKKFTDYLIVGERAGRSFQHYHCANHKLALAYNDVVYSKEPSLQFCSKLIDHCNDLARYYSSKSYKRRDEMNVISSNINEDIRGFKRIQKVRWVPWTQSSYETVIQNYRTFMLHLYKVMNPENHRDYTVQQQNAAIQMRGIFSDKNLISTLHMHLDIITQLSKWAKWLEKKQSTVIDIDHWHQSVRREFENMKTTSGTNLGLLLKMSHCGTSICSSLQTFENSQTVTWKGVSLSNNGASQIPQLSTTRNLVMDAMLNSFEERFPSEAVSAFSVLLPSGLQTSTDEDWRKLSAYMQSYHGLEMAIKDQLVNLKNRITASSFYNLYKTDPPEIFWPNALAMEDFLWNDNTRKVIRIALVQPSSTAQVEAGFSVVAGIKTTYRSRLSTSLLQHILRLKFNGPPVKFLPKYRLALDWVNTPHQKADGPKIPRASTAKRSEFIRSMRF